MANITNKTNENNNIIYNINIGETDSLTLATADTYVDKNIIINTNVDLSSKANIDSPSFTGVPTAPTPSIDDNSTKIATTEYVKNKVDELGSHIDGYVPADPIEPADGDIPLVFFGGKLSPNKTTILTVPFQYISKTKTISGYAELKAQGTSSLAYPKKNQTVKMYADAEKTTPIRFNFDRWGEQYKHVYKANWMDFSHARNIVSAQLWSQVVKSRANYDSLPELFKNSPNNGAVDGFPVLVYANNVYMGRYTLNIPKDAWMTNMDSSLDTHCILCSEDYNSGCFRAAAKIDGTDWSDEIHDAVPSSIKTRWNEVIDFVMNSSDEDFVVNLGNYFYVDSLIDYYIFGVLSCGLDAFGKNQLYLTYDGGQKWIASMYDMDSTWGLYWDGKSFVDPTYSRTDFEDYVHNSNNILYTRIEKLMYENIQQRWAELKDTVFSYSNIMYRFEHFIGIVPPHIAQEDYASTTGGGKFGAIPSKTTNNIQQIRSYVAARLPYVNTWIEELTPRPCTEISLSETSLVFDGRGGHTLVATTVPENPSDEIIWSSDNEAVATVNNGLVVAIDNGSAVITATCGKCSASCSVEVSGITSNTLLYKLPEVTTFDGATCIDTGVKLFNTDMPFTLFVDYEHTDAEFKNDTHTIVHCMKEVNPWPGLVLQYAINNLINMEIIQGSGKIKAIAQKDGQTSTTINRMKVVFRKNVDGKISVYRKYDNKDNIYKSEVQGSYVQIPQSLLLGAYQDNNGTKGRYARGILHDCEVHNRWYTDEEVNEWFDLGFVDSSNESETNII